MDVIILVAKYANLSYEEAKTVTSLLDDEATIPFLVRYRKNLIGDLTSEDLRFIKQCYNLAKSIKARADFITKKIQAKNELTPDIKNCIDSAQTLLELDDIYAPYKTAKKTKAGKLREIGFDRNAENLLLGNCKVCPESLVDKKNELLKNIKNVNEMLVILISDLMMGDKDLQHNLSKFLERKNITLSCKSKKCETNEREKFENYYNFNMNYKYVKPHQIMAINRGEKKKMLSVSLNIPETFDNDIFYFAKKWTKKGIQYDYRTRILNEAIKYLIKKKIIPRVTKNIRNELTMKAEKASTQVFSSNLKWLLLTRPVASENYVVLSIDPGFKNGCKVAVVNIKRDILHLVLLNLNNKTEFERSIGQMIERFSVNTIAIGNGQGCREVEIIICRATKKKNVRYIIVSEQGVSIYSCSKEALEEYPDYEPNFISAISLAKRHLDPLNELVKVEPKHLGVGMYQHDVDPKKLDEELNDVVSECVSEVGVDINIASLSLLKSIAGLSLSKAKNIIEARRKKNFVNRKDILGVKGIGPKTFEQCAGFIKIVPETCQVEKNHKKPKFTFEILDQTIIHPDDYEKAKEIIKMAELNINDIGTPSFIAKIKEFKSFEKLASKLKIHETTVKLIVDALSTPLGYDPRENLPSKPLFKTDTISINDVKFGTILTGRIENVTPFGAFVDVGLGKSGLIPFSGETDLHLGLTVSVKVDNIKGDKISLKLLQVL